MPKAVVIGLTIVAMAAAACGEAQEGDDASTFRSSADAVCSERHRAVIQAYDDARERGAKGLALDDATNSAQIEGESSLVEGLSELEPPAGLEPAYAELLSTHEHRRDVLEAAQKATEAGDRKAANADGERASALQDEIYALGRGLGLETCAGAIPADQEPQARAAVERALADRGVSSVEIIEIEGNDQYGEAEVLAGGGDFESEVVNVHVQREGEDWKVAEIERIGSGG